jgi:hypothetical protein
MLVNVPQLVTVSGKSPTRPCRRSALRLVRPGIVGQLGQIGHQVANLPRLFSASMPNRIFGTHRHPPSIDASKVRELKQKGLGASQIAKALKIGRASVYRALET